MNDTPPDAILAAMDAGLDSIEADIVKSQEASTAQAPPAAETKLEDVAVKTDDAAPAPTAEVSSQPSTPTYTKDYQDWLNKYGGDQAKADRAIWETNNRNAQLAKELEEARKATPAPPAETKAETQTPPEVVPEDIKRFDESLRALEAEYAGVTEQHKTVLTDKDKVKTRIGELNDILAFQELDFEADAAAKKELRQQRQTLARLDTLDKELRREASNLSSRYGLISEIRSVKAEHLELRAARAAEITERESRKVDAEIETFGRTFLSSIPEVAKDGDPIPPELMAQWDKYARKESHLRLNVEDLPTTEVRSFLTTLKKDFLAEIDQAHRAMAARYAARKTADAEVNAPDGKAAVATTAKKSGFRSQAEVDAFMENAANF